MSHAKLILVLGTLATFLVLPGPRAILAEDEAAAADEKFLKENGVTPDGPGLLKFFRDRTLSDKDRENLLQLIRQLGHKNFRMRQKASRSLIAAGTQAVPLLKEALKDEDLEVHDRAAKCIEKIEKGPGPALPAAAARLL